jgi:hypothetical protein
MKDGVELLPLHRAKHGVAIANVDLVNRNVRLKAGDIRTLDCRIVKVVEVIDHFDRMAKGEAPFDQVRSDKSSSARDENLHVQTLRAHRECGQGKFP